ncbi:YggT family protein [bacterium]|nr:YggT family protein [bacterium]
MQTLRMLTEPVLAPVRRILPDMGGIDFSPVIVLTALQFLGQFLTGG